jgi:hypothetical protein
MRPLRVDKVAGATTTRGDNLVEGSTDDLLAGRMVLAVVGTMEQVGESSSTGGMTRDNEESDVSDG